MLIMFAVVYFLMIRPKIQEDRNRQGTEEEQKKVDCQTPPKLRSLVLGLITRPELIRRLTLNPLTLDPLGSHGLAREHRRAG